MTLEYIHKQFPCIYIKLYNKAIGVIFRTSTCNFCVCLSSRGSTLWTQLSGRWVQILREAVGPGDRRDAMWAEWVVPVRGGEVHGRHTLHIHYYLFNQTNFSNIIYVWATKLLKTMHLYSAPSASPILFLSDLQSFLEFSSCLHCFCSVMKPFLHMIFKEIINREWGGVDSPVCQVFSYINTT